MDLLRTGEYQLTKEKTNYPLTLEYVKRHLRVDNEFVDDDDYILDLVRSATAMAEQYINKDIAKTLNTLRIGDFNSDYLRIYEGNFLELVSVTDEDENPVGSLKQTTKHFDHFTIEWNSPFEADPTIVKFYTGYDVYETPEIIKQAILVQIGNFYDNARTSLVYSGLTDTKVFEKILNYHVAMRF